MPSRATPGCPTRRPSGRAGALPNVPTRRVAYAAAALATVAAGLAVHRGLVPLAPALRDPLGDALWAAMVYWLAGAAAPSARPGRRALAALAAAWVVECGQLVRAPWLVALRATTLGHLVLGADFDRRDLLAYAVGVVAALATELTGGLAARRAVGRRVPPRAGGT